LQNSKSPLKRIHPVNQLKATQLIYRSAVPHPLAAYADMGVAKVANSLATYLSTYRSDRPSFPIPAGLSPSLLDHIDIQATPSGYLEFSFDDWAIAHWLTHLTRPPISLLFGSPTPSSQPATGLPHSLFPIQHAHARCCSLLRLAAEQQMIGLNWLENSPGQWEWAQPTPISWLTLAQRLHLCHPAECQLINQCFTVLDELPWQSGTSPTTRQSPLLHPSRIATLAQDLAQAFHTWHQQGQIWGALQHEAGDRLTAHLALILVTQKLLYGLLQIGLGIIAPEVL
jgi:hypothetical protein